jgi:hypothetical protein
VDLAEIEVSAPSNDTRDRVRAEGELRERVQSLLRNAGVLEHQTGVKES